MTYITWVKNTINPKNY